MQKRWNILKEADSNSIDKITKELGIDRVLANILVQRGIEDFEAARTFFRPDISNLHDPFLMKDMEKAIDRIDRAINNNEKILIYGDYDVDGTTAVAIVYSFFKRLYKNVDYYIPDRYNEGYGISKASIDFAVKNNITLIIALDCGIKAGDKIDYANEKGVEYIICDHHTPPEKIPDAHAILNAKRIDCTYPYKELSGCGVGFKLLQGYTIKHEIPFEEIEDNLDLVSVSIASDVVSVTGENRLMAYYGLKRINSNPRASLEALMKCGKFSRTEETADSKPENVFKKELTINDLAYIIGPRINAAGRIESGAKAVELLLCEDINYATVLASYIDSNNNTRRSLDTQITAEALKNIKEDSALLNNKSTFVYNPDWHIGVIGIVASRLIENYYRPTIVLSDKNGLIIGSARSVKNFDIYETINACSDLLEHFGGHRSAAGLSLKPSNLAEFQRRFEQEVNDRIDEIMLVPEIDIDSVLDFNSITPKFIRVLKQFAPFGPDNMPPVFISKTIKDTGYASVVGINHLKLNLMQPAVSEQVFGAIAFSQAQHFDYISSNKPFDICYTIEENQWNGNTSIQLNIKDIKYLP